jgi:hypothetical protein
MQAAALRGSTQYRRASAGTTTLNDRDITGVMRWRMGGNPVVSHGH